LKHDNYLVGPNDLVGVLVCVGADHGEVALIGCVIGCGAGCVGICGGCVTGSKPQIGSVPGNGLVGLIGPTGCGAGCVGISGNGVGCGITGIGSGAGVGIGLVGLIGPTGMGVGCGAGAANEPGPPWRSLLAINCCCAIGLAFMLGPRCGPI